MTRRLVGFVAAAALAGGMALSAGVGTQALAGNSWDRDQDSIPSQYSPDPSGDGNSWD